MIFFSPSSCVLFSMLFLISDTNKCDLVPFSSIQKDVQSIFYHFSSARQLGQKKTVGIDDLCRSLLTILF